MLTHKKVSLSDSMISALKLLTSIKMIKIFMSILSSFLYILIKIGYFLINKNDFWINLRVLDSKFRSEIKNNNLTHQSITTEK